MPCEVCHEVMREIGPFAMRKLEGEPSQKFDGKRKFQCVNEVCENNEKIVEIDVSVQDEYLESLKQQCQCGHSKFMHKEGFSKIEPGQSIPVFNKEIPCKSGCGCLNFTLQQ